MDKIELKVMGWTGIILVSFLVALLYAAQKKNIDLPVCVPYGNSFSKPHIKQTDTNVYEAFIVARMWGFEPNEIYVPVGSEVDIYLTSLDVVHGFHIEKKAVNMMAVPGAIIKKTVRFDKPGIYKIVCHEYCGTGHQNMQGEIIVNYKTK